jgi:subtilisin family serine protease
MILPVRVGVTELDVPKPYDSIAAGIGFATEQGANVVSISISAADTVDLRAAVADAAAHDVVVVAGIGNRPNDLAAAFPARYPGVVGVGAVDRTGTHADFSITSPEVDIVAPGVDIVSTAPGGGYRVGTGTSDATAIVAGAAALIRSRYPSLPAAEVVHRLLATADDRGAPGRDDAYGYGVLNLVRALTATVPPAATSAAPSTGLAPSSFAPLPPVGSPGLPVGWLAAGGAAAVLVAAVVVDAIRRRRRLG